MSNDGELRDLSGFLFFKHFYSKAVIYNYTPRSLSKRIGLSVTLIKRYMAIFEKRKWIIKDGNHIRFAKMNDVDDNKFKRRYELDIKGSTISEINDLLLLQIIKFKNNQFQYIKKAKSDLLKNVTDLKDYKRLKRIEKKYDLRERKIINGESSNLFNISMQKLGYLLNISRSSASLLVNRLSKKQLLTIVRNVFVQDIQCWNSNITQCLLDNKGHFVFNNKIYKIYANSYIF